VAAEGLLDGIQQSLRAGAGGAAIGATDVPGGIRLRCDILSARASAPLQLAGSNTLDNNL
jgi:hypothetical protein